jgi:hypothetical protein
MKPHVPPRRGRRRTSAILYPYLTSKAACPNITLMPALIFLFALLLLPLSACTKREDSDSAALAERSEPSSSERAPVPQLSPPEPQPPLATNRLSREEYFARIFVPAYEKHGRKNPKWNAAATNFLAKLSTSAGGHGSTNHTVIHEEIEKATRQIEQLACEDPLIRYMVLRQRYDAFQADESTTNLWVQAALDLESTGYPMYWKFFSYMRAAEALSAVSGRTNSPVVIQYRNAASVRLIELLKDKSTPTSVVLEAAGVWINGVLNRAPKLRTWTYDQVEPLLLEGWGDTAEAWFIRGRYYIGYAWVARGSGWASTVSDQGWKLMQERLQVARESLEKSWNISPIEDVAVSMITLNMGDTGNRAEMERWFNRAMELNPASYNACEAKLLWLMPKWHGSAREAIAFGRECVTNTAWKGDVPLHLYHAHRQLATWYLQSEQGTENDYWKLPGVWPDVRASFEEFLEQNPDRTGWRHDYALAAYQAEAWDDLRKQIKLLGPINYAFFGGKPAFEEMARKAQQNGNP